MTSHYLMLILLENTLMQLSLEGCYNLYWVALSPVNRNKVNIGFKRPMFCVVSLLYPLIQKVMCYFILTYS